MPWVLLCSDIMPLSCLQVAEQLLCEHWKKNNAELQEVMLLALLVPDALHL